MTTTIPIDDVNAVAAELLACVCEQLALTAAGCPARRCLVPGSEVSVENCCGGAGGGQLSINIGRMYPSGRFPVPDTGERNCDASLTVVDFYISVFRCMPTGIDPATCDALTDTYQTTTADMNAIRTGVQCCLSTEERRRNRFGYGDHLTLGPQGDCVGSILLVAVSFLNCKGC